MMKAHAEHTDRHYRLSSILFGIIVSIFIFGVFFNFFQNRQEVYTYPGVSSLIGQKVIKPVAAPVTDVFSIDLKALLTEAVEMPLVVDTWMADASEWTLVADGNVLDLLSVEVVEAPLQLESWMLNADSWGAMESVTSAFVEQEVALETWMLDANMWAMGEGTLPVATVDFVENEIALESWMLNTSAWSFNSNLIKEASYSEDEIELEAWMLNTSEWSVLEVKDFAKK
ncbi:MAG: hypothetical protein JEZ14_03020 [Marinilabiliaceae bacterium]|nr:hypothetical protein [Marinilabiliaceae bacterium]